MKRRAFIKGLLGAIGGAIGLSVVRPAEQVRGLLSQDEIQAIKDDPWVHQGAYESDLCDDRAFQPIVRWQDEYPELRKYGINLVPDPRERFRQILADNPELGRAHAYMQAVLELGDA